MTLRSSKGNLCVEGVQHQEQIYLCVDRYSVQHQGQVCLCGEGVCWLSSLGETCNDGFDRKPVDLKMQKEMKTAKQREKTVGTLVTSAAGSPVGFAMQMNLVMTSQPPISTEQAPSADRQRAIGHEVDLGEALGRDFATALRFCRGGSYVAGKNSRVGDPPEIFMLPLKSSKETATLKNRTESTDVGTVLEVRFPTAVRLEKTPRHVNPETGLQQEEEPDFCRQGCGKEDGEV
ncbi:hypothetical protein Bbelb_032330 [Branchiostoma belcheri]|nr:hypothetical protein Bbelb_032330 [Branchiostoma belcheri]